jgi:hypothetical protein
VSEFTAALQTVMLLGAARSACQGDAERLARLRELAGPLEADVMAGRWAQAQGRVRAVMPEGWEPPAEWGVVP